MGRLSPSPPRAAPRSPPRPSRPPLVVNHGDLALLESFEERYAKDEPTPGLAKRRAASPGRLSRGTLSSDNPARYRPAATPEPFSPARGTSPPRAASPRVIRAPSPPRSPARAASPRVLRAPSPPPLALSSPGPKPAWRPARSASPHSTPRSTPRGASSPGRASTTRAVASECAVSGGGLREATLRSEARLTIVARDSAGVQRTSGACKVLNETGAIDCGGVPWGQDLTLWCVRWPAEAILAEAEAAADGWSPGARLGAAATVRAYDACE